MVIVVDKSVLVTVFAGKHTGTTGTADGVGHKTVGKKYTLVGNAIDIGSLDESLVVCTDCLQ